MKWLTEVSDKFRDFIIENSRNGLLWIVLFFAGLIVFALTYRALHNDK